jgi:uncharacterized protein (TIGR02452 family)
MSDNQRFVIIKDDYVAPTPEEETMRALDPMIWRSSVWADTQSRRGRYPCAASVKIAYNPTAILAAVYMRTTVEVTEEDSIVAAARLRGSGLNPCVLNFADDIDAGGCVDAGSRAQEESLWRRTNLFETQDPSFYPLTNDPPEAIYTPAATVFKDTEAAGCVDLDAPFQLAFIAMPGIKYPITSRNTLSKTDTDILRRKIVTIFQIAKTRAHDTLVLGPLGCGAWNNPPAHVAAIFREQIAIYDGVFKHITFACLTPTTTPHTTTHAGYLNNYEIFKSTFAIPFH